MTLSEEAAVELASAHYGAGPPVVVLHGLFGSARNWRTIAERLGRAHAVHVLDLRNHGASPWTATMSYPEMAGDVLAYMAAHGLEGPALLGHSMGGKVAMTAALAAPERVGRLVVVDVAPVAYRRGFGELVAALAALDLARVRRRADADAMLADAIPDAALRAFLLQNLVAEAGAYRWRINLAAIGAAQAELWRFPEPPTGTAYDGPALFVSGARSGYVRAEHLPAIRQWFPAAEPVEIEGAGHLVHVDRPEAFLAAVEPFLDRAA